jgi:hypothetical protein
VLCCGCLVLAFNRSVVVVRGGETASSSILLRDDERDFPYPTLNYARALRRSRRRRSTTNRRITSPSSDTTLIFQGRKAASAVAPILKILPLVAVPAPLPRNEWHPIIPTDPTMTIVVETTKDAHLSRSESSECRRSYTENLASGCRSCSVAS